MVHQVPVQERAPRKRDRRTAGLTLTPGGGPDLQSMRGAEFKGEIHPPPAKLSRLGMYETYQPWVLQTYGDSAKTKTITRNKYQRILQILRGDYVDNETSKFKLWVKGRGFRIGTPPGYLNGGTEDPIMLTQITQTQPLDYNPDKDPYPDIYVQTGTVKCGSSLSPAGLPKALLLLVVMLVEEGERRGGGGSEGQNGGREGERRGGGVGRVRMETGKGREEQEEE
ncbi:hypothetical protein Pmani_032208 [Petrolisthes manimaculis]|uniref:Nucleolar protein 4 n=1 Tax=Petrolisthes manimaculis TaxID=1843537 RepID=A0AAE1NTK8_9EUCA|nr:hypothetical protein Pmani_032208 [Petrolisthes manimaculis]